MKFRFPPCMVSPFTEEVYPRHEFVIQLDRRQKPKLIIKNGVTYYHTVCERCGFVHPKPSYH